MKRLDAKLAQLLEFPRYLWFVREACGAAVALKAAAWTLLSVPDILRSGTLRAVDARLSAHFVVMARVRDAETAA